MVTKLFQTSALILLMTLLPTSALAVNGATPNGRPFVEINGQIAEVKSDLSALEARYQDIITRIGALEGDLQGQIDALNSEVSALHARDALLAQQISQIANLATRNGYNIEFALAEINRLQSEIDALNQMGGDHAAAIAALEADLASLEADVAANAAGLLSTLAEVRQNSQLINRLQTDVHDLQIALAGKQNDIVNYCQSGYYAYGVADNGMLLCRQDQTSAGVGSLGRAVISGSMDIDNTEYQYCGIYIGSTCVLWLTGVTPGDGGGYVTCPEGYTVAGGGFYTSHHNDIGVEYFYPYGNGWAAYFDNRSTSGTDGYWGVVYANCLIIY